MHGPLKRRYPATTLHSVTTQKTWIWNITAMKASKLSIVTVIYAGSYKFLCIVGLDRGQKLRDTPASIRSIVPMWHFCPLASLHPSKHSHKPELGGQLHAPVSYPLEKSPRFSLNRRRGGSSHNSDTVAKRKVPAYAMNHTCLNKWGK
jgi:hypothetical protein